MKELTNPKDVFIESFLETSNFKRQMFFRFLKVEKVEIKELKKRYLEIYFDTSSYGNAKNTKLSKIAVRQMKGFLPNIWPYKAKLYHIRVFESPED